jgi:peptidoglycan/xylan/chitin deacetylase (PgdA/CDA1 family)
MFLVLEGHSPGKAVRNVAGGRLGRLVENYLDHLASGPDQASLLDAATALEVLAAYHFDPEDGEDPVTGVAAFGGLSAGPLIRTINFHNTIQARSDEIERQLRAAGERFRTVGEDDLDGLLSGGAWPWPKPPLILVFYEGYRNNYEVALPVLERLGMRAWFFVPTAFIDTPVPEQHAFAGAHSIGLTDEDRPGYRCAMTWDELRDVASRGHIVACHTATHCAISDVRTPQDVQRELVGPRRRLEQELGREVGTLAWLSGAPYGENDRVDPAVYEAGYHLVFSNTKIQRLRAG